MIDNLLYWWEYTVTDKITTLYYNIKYGVKNLIYFLPTIWKHRGWDYSYHYIILRKSIEHQRDLTSKYSLHTNADKDVLWMTRAIWLLDRIIEDDYVYSEVTWSDNKQSMSCKYFHPLNRGREDYKHIIRYENNRRIGDIKELGKILYKYGGSWWY